MTEFKLSGNPKNVVMRFAPNPNGPPTIGSARGIVINSEFSRKYNGKFILRFDDTDPKTKRPMLEAYEWYIEDCKWLGAKPDEVYIASERISNYYPYAEELIKLGKAYVCFCKREDFKALKDSKKACPHREIPAEKNLEFWKNMLKGSYSDGECVLRIKTDIRHEDPAIRDWVAFRILREEHPRVGRKFIVWPMLDFESAIEDHLLNVTHIIRGKDLADSEKRQRFVYEYLGWNYPVTMHWGRVRVEECGRDKVSDTCLSPKGSATFGKFSTSRIRAAIESGEYTGWDDPRLPTVRALERRGIKPDAIRNLMLNLGISENDISLSLENLFAENRKIIDKETNRYFFVDNPAGLIVHDFPTDEINVKLPLHPNFRERGFREFHLKKDESGNIKFFISGQDFNELKMNQNVRLMNLFNVEILGISPEKKSITAKYLEEKRLDVKKIQWVYEYTNADVLMPDGLISGFCELNCRNIGIGDVVQFERFGFVRLEEKNGKLKFCFGHR